MLKEYVFFVSEPSHRLIISLLFWWWRHGHSSKVGFLTNYALNLAIVDESRLWPLANISDKSIDFLYNEWRTPLGLDTNQNHYLYFDYQLKRET